MKLLGPQLPQQNGGGTGENGPPALPSSLCRPQVAAGLAQWYLLETSKLLTDAAGRTHLARERFFW